LSVFELLPDLYLIFVEFFDVVFVADGVVDACARGLDSFDDYAVHQVPDDLVVEHYVRAGFRH